MSWAESHVVTRRILQEAVQKCKAFTCRRRVGQGSYQQKVENNKDCFGWPSFGGRARVYDAGSRGTWRGPRRQITSLVLTRKFQTSPLGIHSWGRSKLQLGQRLNLGWISGALAQVLPFWICGFLCNTRNHPFLSILPLPLLQSTPIPSSLHPSFSSPCHPSLPQRPRGSKSLCNPKRQGFPGEREPGMAFWQKWSHWQSKPFCDLSPTTSLLEQISVTMILREQ